MLLRKRELVALCHCFIAVVWAVSILCFFLVALRNVSWYVTATFHLHSGQSALMQRLVFAFVVRMLKNRFSGD